jgi:GNAT superfamily N-acetyltransferase
VFSIRKFGPRLAPRVKPSAAVGLRPALVEDAGSIAELMGQLGYDVAAERISERLGGRNDQREVFVAENAMGVVGWAGVRVEEGFVEGRHATIEGLVVDARVRSTGVGAQLLQAVEAWARTHGCDAVRVQSNVIRERAHAFYERHGYLKLKAQFAFRKTI